MSNKNSKYDGAKISELGAKNYLKGYKAQPFANIDILSSGQWGECNACHGTPYRSLKYQATWNDVLQMLDSVSPAAAGFVDGVQHQTVGKVQRTAGGINRTAEGLHITGEENFQNVGDENYAAYMFAKTTFDQLMRVDINLIDNPVSQAVTAIVSEYISVIPEWVIEDIVVSGALKLNEHIDVTWLSKAFALGLIDGTSRADLLKTAKLLNEQRFIGKQIGKKVAIPLSYAIATYVTKKIVTKKNFYDIKTRLPRVREAMKPLNGGLGGTMLKMLAAQGFLDKAGQASRRLQGASPRVWNTLRYKLHGANMVYFLIEPMVTEYVDRLALLEKNPQEFIDVMAALIKHKQTDSILYASRSFRVTNGA